MKKALIFILTFLPLCLFAQLRGDFELVGACGVFSNVNDSTYRGNITFQSDQFADGYLPTQIQIGYLGVDAKGDTYSVVAVNSSDFSSANLDLQRDTSTQTAPTGIILIYKDLGSGIIPSYAVNSTGISPILEARIHRHNANVINTGDGIDSLSAVGNTVFIYTPDSTYSFQLQLPIIGTVWYVSPTGVDSTALKGDISNPFSDPWAAVDTATTGDVVVINPGSYTNADNTRNLWKDGITIFAFPGVSISGTTYDGGTGSGDSYFYPEANDETMVVYGDMDVNGPLIVLDSVENCKFTWYGLDYNAMRLDAGAKNNQITTYVKQVGGAKNYLWVDADAAQDSILDNTIRMFFDNMDYHNYLVDFTGDNDDKCNRNTLVFDIKNTDVPTTQIGDDRGYFADASISKRFIGWNVTIRVQKGRWRQDGVGGSYDYNVFGGAYYANDSRDNQMTIECQNCQTIGSVRPLGDFYYNGWDVYMRGNYFHDATTGQAPIAVSNAQSSPTQEGWMYFDANIVVEGSPAFYIAPNTVLNVVFSGNMRRLDAGPVIETNSGVNGNAQLIAKDLVIEAVAGDTAVAGTGGNFYAAGVYDNTPSFNGTDPDINYIGLPRYARRTLGEQLPYQDVIVDGGDLYDFRLNNADQIVLDSDGSQAINSTNGNITVTADQGDITLNGASAGEIKLQGTNYSTAITYASDFDDGINGVVVENSAGQIRKTGRLLPSWDTLIVTTANDTIDLARHLDQVAFLDMTSAPSTVTLVVENPANLGWLHMIFLNVGGSHTINFTHSTADADAASSFDVTTTSNQNGWVFRYVFGSWIANYMSP